MDSLNLTELLTRAIGRANAELGDVNVLNAGRTGVGKSTLINAVFHSRLAETGHGEPVTKTTRTIQKEGVPLRIFDTRGLEMAEYAKTVDEVTNLIQKKAQSADINDHIHCAWLCVAEPGRRVERAEQDICRALAAHTPVVGVVTKATSDQGFRAEVQRLLPETKNVMRVLAAETILDDGHSVPPSGLDELMELTASVKRHSKLTPWRHRKLTPEETAYVAPQRRFRGRCRLQPRAAASVRRTLPNPGRPLRPASRRGRPGRPVQAGPQGP